MKNTRDQRRRLRYELDVARGRPAKRPKTVRCVRCKAKIPVRAKGRLPKYCSPACCQRMYEYRKWQRPHIAHLGNDLSRMAMREMIRREVWEQLRAMGLASAPESPKSRRKPPLLRVVEPDDGSAS
jgi:hypothetical protein